MSIRCLINSLSSSSSLPIFKFSPSLRTILPLRSVFRNFSSPDTEIFFEQVEKPVNITVAYYGHEEKTKINLRVESPSGKEVFKINKKTRGFYEFEANERGKYEFQISHEKVK